MYPRKQRKLSPTKFESYKYGIVLYNMSTPKYDDLLAELTELPAYKVGDFAAALRFPQSQSYSPEEARKGLEDALKWWVEERHKDSWEAIAAALETEGVDEQCLAKQIRTKHVIHQRK